MITAGVKEGNCTRAVKGTFGLQNLVIFIEKIMKARCKALSTIFVQSSLLFLSQGPTLGETSLCQPMLS